jgi:hypothetical protein
MRPAGTPQNLSSSSGHASKACMRSAQAPWLQAAQASVRPCIRSRSRAHSPLLARGRCPICTISLHYLPEAQSKAVSTCDAIRCERGGSPSTAEAVESPICPPPSAGSDAPDHARALSGSTLLPWPKSAQNKANAQQWSRGRVRGLICGLVQPSAPHGLRIMGSTGCSRCWV